MKKFFSGILLVSLVFMAHFANSAYDGNGNFNRVHNWTNDKNAGIKIDSGRMDAEDNGFASGLSNAITKDGQTTVTADIPFNNNQITGLGSASARTEATNGGDVQDGTFLWAGTAGGTVDVITANLSPAITAYITGQKFRFLASGANTGAVTVNFNAVSAKAINKNGGSALGANDIPGAGHVVEVVYDGTDFEYTSIDANTTVDLASPGAIGGTTPAAGTFTTLGSTVLSASTSLALATGATVTGIEDSDTMSSNSATLLATQQSIKAYVDAGDVVSSGATVQVVNTTNSAVAFSTNSIPYDDTIPQNTEGFELFTRAITPGNTNNKIKIEVVVNFALSAAQVGVVALFQDTTAGALAVAAVAPTTANDIKSVSFIHYMTASTISATTFKVRGGAQGTTFTLNGDSSARRFGGVISSSITITEIKV